MTLRALPFPPVFVLLACASPAPAAENRGAPVGKFQQLGELLGQRQHEIESWTEQTADLEREAGTQRARAAQLAETLTVA